MKRKAYKIFIGITFVSLIILFAIAGQFLIGKDELKLISSKPEKVWNLPGSVNNRFIIAANNIIKYCYTGNKKSTPTSDTLFYYLDKIDNANYNIVRATLAPDGNQEQDEYYYNFFKALEKVNSKYPYVKLKCIVCDNRIFSKSPKETSFLLNKYYNREDVYGFNVDEPKEKEFKHLAEWSVFFNSLPDISPLSKKLFYVNLFGSTSITDYIHYVNSWITSNKPSLLSFDNYCLWDDALASKYGDDIGSDWGDEYYYNLEVFRNASSLNKLPFVNWILIHKHFSTYSKKYYRRAKPQDISYQMYSALAYGSKGIFQYNFWNPSPSLNNNGWNEESGVLDYDGNETDLYKPIAALNKEISIVGNVLVNLTNTGTYLNSMSPVMSKTGINKEFNKSSSSPGELYGIKLLNNIAQYSSDEIKNNFLVSIDNKFALVGQFKNSKGNKFFMLVNMDRKNAEEMIVILDKSKVNKKARLLNYLSKNKIKPFAFDGKGNPKFKLKLTSGGGILLGVVI